LLSAGNAKQILVTMAPRAITGANNTNRESDDPDSDSEYSPSTSADSEREQGGNPDTEMTEGGNIKLANPANSQTREDADSHMTGLNTGESANQTPNDVQEWLGALVKAENDPTADSYPGPPQLNKTTALAWLTKPENNRWEGDKRAKEQRDFNVMDELWTKVTGIEISTRTKGLALRGLINNACETTLDLTCTKKPVTPAELLKIRHLTRAKLEPLLKNHLLSYNELTPWMDEFLRVYMPRAVFAWKNWVRQNRVKLPAGGAGRDGQKDMPGKTAVDSQQPSRAASAAPRPKKAKRKPEDSNTPEGPPKKTRNTNIQGETQHNLSQQPLPFVRREIELSVDNNSDYAIIATAAIIEPAELSNAVVSASHLSFDLLRQIATKAGGDFANIGKNFEIWDPLERVSIRNDFQLRNSIGLQWARMMYVEDQLVFRLEIRPMYRY
jgi:hypothetical protein